MKLLAQALAAVETVGRTRSAAAQSLASWVRRVVAYAQALEARVSILETLDPPSDTALLVSWCAIHRDELVAIANGDHALALVLAARRRRVERQARKEAA